MLKIENPQIIWQTGKAPYSKVFEDYYFGVDQGVEESNYIFLKGNDLENRFKAINSLPKYSKSKISTNNVFCIAETGFGTATNFLLSAELWLKTAPVDSCLHYISFEKYPLNKQELLKAHAGNDIYIKLLNELINCYPFLLPGRHDMVLLAGRIKLTLWFGDVQTGLPEFDDLVDAWFLDGFTPSKNQDMWQEDLYSQMARLSHNKASFATFSTATNVRKGLEQAGFSVKKRKGFAKKREMCFGQLIHHRSFSPVKPWFSAPKSVQLDRPQACIIGAGLAGAAVAYKLASQGWQVTIIEAEKEVATLASGNLAGAIHPLITADWNIRSQFYLKGYETTLSWLEKWLEQKQIIGDLNGLMQLAIDEKTQKRLQDCLRRVGLPEDFARWCDKEQASEIVGTETEFSGMFFPKAGWVNPPSVVKKCLEHENISIFTNHKVNEFKQLTNKTWQITTDKRVFTSPILVIATAGLDTNLNTQLGMDIRPVKGQVSHLDSGLQAEPLKTTVTHQGYSIGSVCIDGKNQSITGATFESPDLSIQPSAQANADNIKMAKTALPSWLSLPTNIIEQDYKNIDSKVGFRPTLSDHLPIIGAVVDNDYARENYYSQSHTHAVFRYPEQKYQQGLYVSNGHGARGLMSVFLAAEMIYAQLVGNKQVLANNLLYATHAERFKIRSWRSGI